MSRDSLLDFYREIVNSEKSFGVDYKNLSKQLIEMIDKAIERLYEIEINASYSEMEQALRDVKHILGDKEQ